MLIVHFFHAYFGKNCRIYMNNGQFCTVLPKHQIEPWQKFINYLKINTFSALTKNKYKNAVRFTQNFQEFHKKSIPRPKLSQSPRALILSTELNQISNQCSSNYRHTDCKSARAGRVQALGLQIRASLAGYI